MPVEKITLETRLAELVLVNFTDWEIYPEVVIKSERNANKSGAGSGGSIDVYMKKGVITKSIECKLKTNFAVLGQAYRNKAYANFSYVCVPHPKSGFFDPFFITVCKEFGIGVLTVSENDQLVREIVKPRFNRTTIKLVLEDYMKQSVAGSLHGRMTQFKYTIENIVKVLQRSKGRMNLNNLFDRTTFHWKTPASAKQNILEYIRKELITEFRMEGNYIILNSDTIFASVDQPTQNVAHVPELKSEEQMAREKILKELLNKK